MTSRQIRDVDNSNKCLDMAKHHVQALQSITRSVPDEQRETLKNYLTCSFSDILTNFNLFENEQNNIVDNVGVKPATLGDLSDIVESSSKLDIPPDIPYIAVSQKDNNLGTNFVFLNVNPSGVINDLHNSSLSTTEKVQYESNEHFGQVIEGNESIPSEASVKQGEGKNTIYDVNIFSNNCTNQSVTHEQNSSIQISTQVPFNTSSLEEMCLENSPRLESCEPTQKHSIEQEEDYTEDNDVEMKDGTGTEQNGILEGADVGCLLSFVPHINGQFIQLENAGEAGANNSVIHLTVERTDGTVQNLEIGGLLPVALDQQNDTETDSKQTTSENQDGPFDSALIINKQETNSKKENASDNKSKSKIGRPIGRPKAPQLFNQVITDQNEIGYQCPYCADVTKTQPAMKVHLRIHTGEKPFSCQYCGKSFTTKGNKQQHEKIAHGTEKPWKCQYCDKTFKEKKVCQVHERVHTGERPFKCSVCSKAFSQRGVLKEHMLIHTGQKPHLCDLCGQEFRGASALKLHKLRHLNQKDYHCRQCGQEFISKYDLKRHCMAHEGLKPFLCSYCPKGFTRLNYLKEHLNVHKGERPFICQECGAAYSDSVSLHRHRKKHKADFEEHSKCKQDSELAKELTSGSIEQSLSEQELLRHPSVQLILDENTTNEDLQRLQSIVLSNNDYSVNNQDPAKQIFQVLCVNPDTQEMSSVQQMTDVMRKGGFGHLEHPT